MEGCSQTTTEVIGMDAHSRKLALCLMRREGGKLVKVKTVATTLDALEGTYRKQMPPGALTVLEASTNSFCIAARLKALGFDAKVLNADVLSGLSRQDRVNDRIDAENLARAYLRYGSELRVVYTPTERGIDMRETFFAYRDARKDTTRAANRIWSFCSRHGFDVDRKIGKKRCAEIVANAKASGLSAPVVGRVEGLVKDWTDAVARCAGREKAIVRAVAANADMTRLLQVPGIRFIGAFAIVAFVEDIRRFESPKKFVSYVGLNPSVCGSGASSPCSAGTSSWTIRFPAGTGRPSPRANSHCSRARPGLRPSAPQVMNLPWISLKTIVLVFTDICQNGRSRRSRFVLMLDKPHRCVLCG